MVWIQAALMAVTTAVAGLAPLYLKFDSKEIQLVGSGIILGTAFLIVIPEGIEVMSQAGAKLDSVGYPMFFGYMLMNIIDSYYNSLEDNKSGTGTTELDDLSSVPSSVCQQRRERYLAPMCPASIGMIIHSFADGIALGAASTSDTSLQVIVFISVLIHKAPAGFGFCTTLQSLNLPQHLIKRDVILFSLTAPLAAILTSVIMGASDHVEWWAGEGLLLSGGTFVFVAMHTQPEVKSSRELLLILFGSLFPIVASFFTD